MDSMHARIFFLTALYPAPSGSKAGEKALREGLSVCFMTDESDNSDGGINVKQLPWQSVIQSNVHRY